MQAENWAIWTIESKSATARNHPADSGRTPPSNSPSDSIRVSCVPMKIVGHAERWSCGICLIKNNGNFLRTEGPVESLQNSVKARIAGLDLPFVGVDGVDACNNIYEQDGTTKAKCPLAAGKEYIYKNTIDVLQIYPSVSLVVPGISPVVVQNCVNNVEILVLIAIMWSTLRLPNYFFNIE